MRIGILFATSAEVPESVPYRGLDSINVSSVGGNYIGVLVSGIGRANAARSVGRLCEEFRPDYIVSSGICGGTQTNTNLGDLLVADSVHYNNHEISLAGHELDRMMAFLAQTEQIGHYCVGKFQTFDHLVTPETRVRPDVIGVDVESYAVATAAHQNRTPLVIVRAVSDLVFTGEFLEEHFAAAKERLGLFFQAYLRQAAQNL